MPAGLSTTASVRIVVQHRRAAGPRPPGVAARGAGMSTSTSRPAHTIERGFGAALRQRDAARPRSAAAPAIATAPARASRAPDRGARPRRRPMSDEVRAPRRGRRRHAQRAGAGAPQPHQHDDARSAHVSERHELRRRDAHDRAARIAAEDLDDEARDRVEQHVEPERASGERLAAPFERQQDDQDQQLRARVVELRRMQRPAERRARVLLRRPGS